MKFGQLVEYNMRIIFVEILFVYKPMFNTTNINQVNNEYNVTAQK